MIYGGDGGVGKGGGVVRDDQLTPAYQGPDSWHTYTYSQLSETPAPMHGDTGG
jgi:hypothetical protein